MMASKEKSTNNLAPASSANKLPVKFGTFSGVFIPSVMTIFGVIMYLRMGWVVGNVGLFSTLLIVTIASLVTFITGLSISATATNMNVQGGGAYYMISRSLGLEAGAAVGVPLFLAQALGISFYLAGFAESVYFIVDAIPQYAIAMIALGAVFVTAYTSAGFALKSQFFIFVLIICSLISFFMGKPPSETVLQELATKIPDVSFWTAFAVFFPAVTGILAGVSMSGDLKEPAKSLPLGTLLAVVAGFIVYMLIPVFLVVNVSDPDVLKSSIVMQKISLYEPLIIAGVWGATLSSAIGAMLGAPRTLQALARDGILSKYLSKLGKGHGEDDSPRIATFITLIVAGAGVMLGDLNAIAPILSMFYLTSYGVLNFSAGIEGLIGNPAWRPRFRFPWIISLAGAFLCFSVMFMIDSGSSIVALLVAVALYNITSRRKLKTDFGDLKRGILMALARYSIFKLSALPKNTHSWRPNILVFSGSPTSRWYLIELAEAITHGKGFLSVATILPKDSSAENRMSDIHNTISEYLRKRGINALVSVSASEDVIQGVVQLVRSYGMGTVVPNTIVLGDSKNEENYQEFAEMMIRVYQTKRNIMIIRKGDEELDTQKVHKRVDVWWGRERENAGLSLTLGYMLQNSPKLAGAELHLNSIVTSVDEAPVALKSMEEFIKNGRFDAKANVYVTEPDKSMIFDKIRSVSQDAVLVFMGIEPPKLDKFVEDKQGYIEEYSNYYVELLNRTEGFPPTAIILTAEDIKFSEIFK
jgi:solute carrier family 12 (sodium/potassium/chloride transporter), member 2